MVVSVVSDRQECSLFPLFQVFEGLKPSDKFEKTLDYRWDIFTFHLEAGVVNNSCINWLCNPAVCRWPARYDQWWECKFIAEGIIDQGGGFRDSLSDMSEELCPSSAECNMPLPFFCRTSNQVTGALQNHTFHLHRLYLSPDLASACLAGCVRSQRLLRPQPVL